MNEELENTKELLKGLAEIVNSFKSEPVQMRVLDVLLSKVGLSDRRDKEEIKSKPQKSPKHTSRSSGTPESTPRVSKRVSSGQGAFAVVSDLLEGSFFEKGQTIGQIVDHLQHNSGRKFKSNEISPPLLRLLRDNKLKRQKNAEKQYEYSKGSNAS